MRTLVVGDMHGAYKAFIQVLQKADFDKDKDQLICLGDVADSWSEVLECFDLLCEVKNLIYIMGNHDFWLYEFFKFGSSPNIWTSQGGQATLDAYLKRAEKDGLNSQKKHLKILENSVYYYVDNKNRLYVHGGFNWHYPINHSEANNPETLMWDRRAFYTACTWEAFTLTHPTKPKNYFKDYTEIFVGHTCTNHGMDYRIGNTLEPLNVANLWNLDQGAGWDGKLTLMDVDTKEYWQSDIVTELYPNERGRK